MLLTENEFLQLIERHKGILHKVARMYCDQAEDREDLQQEIILQTWASMPNFKAESAFSTWLYRIALNTALVHLKKNQKRVDQPTAFEPTPLAHEDYDPTPDHQLQAFYQAIHQLDKVDRAIVLLLIEGKSGKEIAEILGLSEVNVRVKTNRTKEKLKQLLNPPSNGF